jgi:hypothetical protein
MALRAADMLTDQQLAELYSISNIIRCFGMYITNIFNKLYNP